MAAGPPPGWVCCKDNTAELPFQVAGELFAAYSILLAEVSPICWRYYTEVFLWSGSAWREAFAPRAGLGRIDIPSIEQSKPRADVQGGDTYGLAPSSFGSYIDQSGDWISVWG